MKLILTIAAVMSLSLAAQAQNKRETYRLLNDIEQELDFGRHNPEAIRQANQQLRDVLSILRGHNPGPGGRGEFTCIARDDDGRNPWMIGVREPRSVQVKKVAGTVLGDITNCQKSIDNAVFIGRGSALFCGTRDNDGRAPFAVIAYTPNGSTQKLKAIGGSADECINTLRQAKKVRGAAYFCVSKDNDNRSPYVQAVYDAFAGRVEYGNQTFSSVRDCQNSL